MAKGRGEEIIKGQPTLWDDEQDEHCSWVILKDKTKGYYLSDRRFDGSVDAEVRLLESRNIRCGENGYFKTEEEAEVTRTRLEKSEPFHFPLSLPVPPGTPLPSYEEVKKP